MLGDLHAARGATPQTRDHFSQGVAEFRSLPCQHQQDSQPPVENANLAHAGHKASALPRIQTPGSGNSGPEENEKEDLPEDQTGRREKRSTRKCGKNIQRKKTEFQTATSPLLSFRR
jgi:hypothetical protein